MDFTVLKRKIYMMEFNQRDDDIYVASYMKSGTTWVQMILYQLTTNGDMNFKHIYEVSPFLEESIRANQKMDHLPSPRIIKTHSATKFLPRKICGKFIYLMRDGKDVAASLYHHLKPLEPGTTFEMAFDNFFMKLCKDGWFGHLADWLENKKKFNVLYIKYEDLLRDFEGNLEKIIEFCGFNINQSELPRIRERCSFEFMKKHERIFDIRFPIGSRRVVTEEDQFIRSGKVNEGHKYFNESRNKLYALLFNRHLARFKSLECYRPVPEK
jgi:hypothetical protein